VYTPKDLSKTIVEANPSKRYLNILIKGAIESNLENSYIEKLKKQPYYIASDEIKEKRKNLPKIDDLKEFTIDELSKYKGVDKSASYTSCLGYVFDVTSFVLPSWVI
jgi:hypothetical protein